MLEKIQQALARHSRDKGVRILYACESGSRAWGFPSPDSDYDVRFIYAHTQQWYLSLFDQRDVIEQAISDLLDISGWDLRKSLTLLYKSNGALLEWLHSPIVYQQQDVAISQLQRLASESFQALSLCHHYLGMAKTGWHSLAEQEQVKLKTYFYTLRTLLCCEWIINENSIPPVEFPIALERLHPKGAFREAVDQLMQMKTKSRESDRYPRCELQEQLCIVDRQIVTLFETIPGKLPKNAPQYKGQALKQRFDEVFLEILKPITED